MLLSVSTCLVFAILVSGFRQHWQLLNLGINLAGAALVLDLLQEIDTAHIDEF